MTLAAVRFPSLTANLAAGGFPTSFYIIHGIAILLLCAMAFFIASLIRRRNLAGRKLERGEKLLLSFINAENDFIYLKDENYKYAMVNEAYARFCGRRPEEFIGHDDYELFEKALADIRRKTDMEILASGRLTENVVEYRGNASVITKFPVTLSDGKLGLGAHIRDITKERRHDKNQAKLLQRAGILIHLTSHDFKNSHEQLSYVLQQAVELTESKYGFIFYYDEDAKVFTPGIWSADVLSACKIEDAPLRYPLDSAGLCGEVVRRRAHMIINDFEAPNPYKKGYPEGHIKLKRFMSAPILIDSKIVAVVGMANKEEDYEESDVMNLIMVIGGAWQAIQRKAVQEQLHYERNRYLQTLISIGDGVMITDEKGTVEMLNGVAQKLTGWINEEARGRSYKEVFKLSHEDPRLTVEDPVEKVLKTGRIHELGNHAILTSRTGRVYYLEDSAAPIFSDSGDCAGVVRVFRDITQKREQRKRIEYLSYHDQLTGLYNRSFFEEELMRLDKERNLPISILMGDVNGLKLTNDIFGHVYGDELLKTLASVFRRICRADDIIARWGGDEFVILLPKTSKKDAEGIAMRIKDDFASKQVKAIKGAYQLA
jgi:diguanylate cyclase (GGDEF)-like protein/PAS domain S-box-containing protein